MLVVNVRLSLHTILKQLQVGCNLVRPGCQIDMNYRVPSAHGTNNPVEVGWREGKGREVPRQVTYSGVGVVQILYTNEKHPVNIKMADLR